MNLTACSRDFQVLFAAERYPFWQFRIEMESFFHVGLSLQGASLPSRLQSTSSRFGLLNRSRWPKKVGADDTKVPLGQCAGAVAR